MSALQEAQCCAIQLEREKGKEKRILTKETQEQHITTIRMHAKSWCHKVFLTLCHSWP